MPAYVKRPDGAIVEIDPADAQAAANAGYRSLSQQEYDEVVGSEAASLPAGEAVSKGVLRATPVEGVNLETGLSQSSEAFANAALSSATFGQAPGLDTPYARSLGQSFREEHPGQAMAAEALGQAPLMLLGGAAGTAIRGAAAGAGALARTGAFAADVGLNAAIGGAQIEGEDARLAGENFSVTDAAIAGVMTETLGRGGAWAISKTVGGARNLISRATRDAVATDAERSLSKGGWVGDYRVSQHSEAYRDELADLGARDLDTLETATAEVSRQDKKRSRITRVVVDNPAAQHEINVQAVDGLQRLRGALADELADAGGGPAKRLSKQLDDRIAALEEAPKGRKLWRILDENRQALQEYRQDLHQAYDSNPGSAWLSREGLAAIDAAEEATRTALLREDAWGAAAAQMQREYNVPFHEKWFPARKTILSDLHFVSGKDAQGFAVHRGEPAKLRKFLTQLGGTGPDTHRARELFSQYLDGAEAIARAGERDSPKAAREALESVRRLRKNLAQSTFINAAAERTAARGAVAGVAGAGVAGALGLALGGPLAGAGGVLAARSARVGTWLAQVSNRLGLFRGGALSMAELLGKDALPAAARPAEDLAERLTDDILDGPFGVTPSARPPPPGGAIPGQAQRGVGVPGPARPEATPGVGPGQVDPPRRPFGVTPSERPPPPGGAIPGQAQRGVGVPGPARPEATPGVGPGQVGRQDTPRRPAGMEAITPQAPVRVGDAPRRPGGGFEPLERPKSLRVDEPVPSGSEVPSLREGSEVPLPGEVHRTTRAAPDRTEGAADLEARLQPDAGARSREAARMQALTEGEFAHVVDGLNAAGQKAPDGSPLGDFLAKHADDLKTAGLLVAGAGGAALAAPGEDSDVAAAGVGGLAALGLRGRLGHAMLLGARFEATEAGKAEAKSIVRRAIDSLPPPPEMRSAGGGDNPYAAIVAGDAPGLKELVVNARIAETRLTSEESEALMEWVTTSQEIRQGQRTGLHDTTTFESALEQLTVLNPTKHGELYRHIDLDDSGLADLLTRDEFEVGAHMSSSYNPAENAFGPHQLRFTQVDSAGALVGSNTAEMEMVIPKDSRFRVAGRYADAETGNFTFILEEVPKTSKSPVDVGFLAIPAAGAASLAADEPQPGESPTAGASAGFLGAAALFKQVRVKMVSDVARRLFSPTVGRAVARVVARQVYTRAEMAKRQQEFQSWAENPQELVDRVSEGFRDVPPEHAGDVHAGVFRAATFLKSKLPSVTKANAISMRDLPVSAEQLTKFARYEEAALRPREAWLEASARGHVSSELLETTEELYPDLLAELRVAAYLTVREEGPPVTVQAKLQYARLFDGQGEFADPSMSAAVAAMSAMAFAAAVPTKPGGGPAGTSGGVSHVAAASAAPAGLVRLA